MHIVYSSASSNGQAVRLLGKGQREKESRGAYRPDIITASSSFTVEAHQPPSSTFFPFFFSCPPDAHCSKMPHILPLPPTSAALLRLEAILDISHTTNLAPISAREASIERPSGLELSQASVREMPGAAIQLLGWHRTSKACKPQRIGRFGSRFASPRLAEICLKKLLLVPAR
jgi:hypothetical protein